MPPGDRPEPPERLPPGIGLTTTDLVHGWRVRVVQPYQALKRYTCPGCNQRILPRTLHVVAWPEEDPESRRHWHRPCWERHLIEQRRAAARRRSPRRRGSER